MKGDKEGPGNYRGIALLSVVRTIITQKAAIAIDHAPR